MRGVHAAMGALARLQREALDGPCGISKCGRESVGYIQGVSNRPVGVCSDHADAAKAKGWMVHEAPIKKGPQS